MDDVKQKNREKQRQWRERNLERSRELKRLSNYKARGYVPQPRVFTPQDNSQRLHKPFSIQALGERIDPIDEIAVSLCSGCARKYLTKLYCLWCRDTNPA